MIERFIEKEITLKRWRRFKSNKGASASLVIFIISLVLTLLSPIIANNQPVYLNYKGTAYFPVFKQYHPTAFGEDDLLVVNYRELVLAKSDSIIWPIVEWSPNESNEDVESYPSPPTSINIMGTDDRGRDVFTRILYGFKYSIGFAVLVWLMTFSLGIVLGGVSGFKGGKFDLVFQRIVEILSAVPTFLLTIILIAGFGASMTVLVVISAMFGWMGISLYVRGEFLKNRKKEFVEAAQGMGAGNKRIIFKHILPNSLSPIITLSPFTISGGVMALAQLDYLGFGLPVPTPSWGELLSQAQKNFTIAWWLAAFPGAALAITLFLLILIGEGVRDAMDPKLST